MSTFGSVMLRVLIAVVTLTYLTKRFRLAVRGDKFHTLRVIWRIEISNSEAFMIQKVLRLKELPKFLELQFELRKRCD